MNKSLIMASRPKTLVAATAPIAVGTMLAAKDAHQIVWWVVIAAFCVALFLQIATNLINDAEDFLRGADDEHRLGPTRVTQAGMLSPQLVKMWGFFFMGLAFLFGIPLMMRGGWPISLVGLCALVACYSYTAGPFPLAYKGLGEIFVLLFFGLTAVAGLYYLLTDTMNSGALIASMQVGLLAVALIAINNFRDREGDAKVGKNTLAVQRGEAFAKKEILFCYFAPYVLGAFWRGVSATPAFTLPLLTLPLAFFLAVKVMNSKPSAELNKVLALSALLQLSFSFLLAFGLSR